MAIDVTPPHLLHVQLADPPEDGRTIVVKPDNETAMHLQTGLVNAPHIRLKITPTVLPLAALREALLLRPSQSR
jgi:hypothetical protein